jgi:hypothetical protein
VNGVPEDKEWCLRARRQGYRISFAPKAIVGHPARRTMSELKRKWRRLTLESCEGARREGRGPIRVLLRQWAALVAVPPHAFAPLATTRLRGIRTRLMAIWALAELRAYRFVIAHQAVVRGREK